MDLRNKKGLIVFSAFDGMSCAQIALNRIGISIEKYYASEIDKYAINVTQANYPNTIQLGDIKNIRGKDIGFVDLICGGSPCQGFSFAGKGLNFKDPRSKLFFEFVRLWKELKEINPDIKFFLENVQMKYEYELVISKTFNINPVIINAALVSAQNRVRLFWTNINQKPYGLFGDMITDIPQPEDKGILLKDILEPKVSDKYYLSDKMLNYFKTRSANFNNGKVNIRNEEGKASAILKSSSSIDISDNFIKVDTDLKVSKTQNKANCFTAGGNSGGLHSDMTLVVHNSHPRTGDPKKGGTGPLKRNDGKTYAIDTQQPNRIQMGDKIRRLTPIECERLQTVPDNYTNHVSDSQRYKMLGNGWCVDVITHFFQYLKK